MFGLWLIGTLLSMATGVYILGTLDWNEDEKVALGWPILFGSLLWPVLLCGAIAAGPFVGLFWLGDRRRKAKKAKKNNK